MRIGIIGGQSTPSFIKNKESLEIETKYGNIYIQISRLQEHEIFFVQRHGEKSNIPPHKINYRGNIEALAACHVECIFSLGTVGSMKKSIAPGDIVIPHDFIDFTKHRYYTFYDDSRVHIDMTNPFCPFLRNKLIESSEKISSIKMHKNGVYLVTEGPRLETPAEIRYFSEFADIVGMTLIPEITLAREKEMCYASLCIVCNMAAGLQQNMLTANEISVMYKKLEKNVSKLLQTTIESIPDIERNCECKNLLSGAVL